MTSAAPQTGLAVRGKSVSWLGKRLAASLLTLVLITMLVFAATRLLPGDMALMILGKDATAESLAALRAQLHLEDPLWRQYTAWIAGVATGDLGYSVISRVDVAALLTPRLQATLSLIVLSLAVSVPLALVLGFATARREGSVGDKLVLFGSVAINALPEFVLGMLLVILLSTNIWHLFPAVSSLSPGQPVLHQLDKLVLPGLCLVLLQVTYLYRLVRAAVIDVMTSEYFHFARLKGLPEGLILRRHVLPNAIVPAVIAIGTIFAYSVGGMVVVETVFSYPGIGSALTQAVGTRDLPVVQAAVLIIAVIFLISNLVTDALAHSITPPGKGGQK